MNILVTGAAGLLGSRFVEWILYHHPDVKIIAVDDLSGGYRENLPPDGTKNFTFYYFDTTDPRIEYIFRSEHITHVVHFAAYAAEGLSPFIRKFNFINNTVATSNLINLSIKYDVKRFLFTSSMAVYGNNTTPFHEDLIPNPIDPYGVAKFASEMDLRIAGEQHGLDWCIIRPHNVYGRNQNIWDSYRNVLGIWMWQSLNGLPITIYGDGLQTRAFSDMQDCLEPLWTALTNTSASKQIINLGGTQEYTINEAADAVIEVVGYGEIKHLDKRHEVKHAWSTWDKSVQLLGFKHKTSLKTGLQDMWLWAKTQPNRKRFVWPNYELEKGLYPYWNQDALWAANETQQYQSLKMDAQVPVGKRYGVLDK